ncbi:MAG: GNAT family N-acetyltransferase [Streptosporangiaceae bacterium]
MPGTRHEPAAAASAQIDILSGWPALGPLEPAVAALHQLAGTPVTARLAWWRSAVRAEHDAVPVLLALPAPDDPLRAAALVAAALVAVREQDGVWQITSGRPHSDDTWEVAARSADARRTMLAELAGFATDLRRPWQLVLTGLRDGNDAAWLARQLPGSHVTPASPVPGIGFKAGQVTFGPGIRSGLDRSSQRIRQHALSEEIQFERDPDRLAKLRGEIEDVHLARDHDAGRESDLDDTAGVAFWRSVYDLHAARGELEVATLRLDGHLAAYVIAFTDGPAYRVFDGRFAPPWRRYSPGRRLEAAVVEHARFEGFAVLDWMTSVAPEKLVASTWAEPRWTVTAAGGQRPARAAVPRPRSAHGAAGGSRRACTSGGGALGDGALGDGALGDGALGDGALGGGALGGGALGGGALSVTAAAP